MKWLLLAVCIVCVVLPLLKKRPGGGGVGK
jgi:hypothetical protein